VTSAVDSLLATVDLDDPFAAPSFSFGPDQLTALNERLAAGRESIAAVQQAADESGVCEIVGVSDVVPLLFSHTSYKDYPATLVDQGKWRLLAKWLDLYSANPTAAQLDFAGVSSIDDWIARLHSGGHFVFASSGTTGKCSLMNQTPDDVALLRRIRKRNMTWATGALPDHSRVMIFPVPRQPGHQVQRVFDIYGDSFGRPDRRFWLTQTPLLVGEINRAGALRKAMALGSIRPSEVAEAQVATERARERTRVELLELARAMASHHREPMMICGTWAQHWHLTEALSEIGAPQLHPDSVISTGGGLKGLAVPADYEDLIQAQYGIKKDRWYRQYGCTEINSHMVGCRGGRYHIPPWVVPLVLGKNGEQLAQENESITEGRMAFFDFAVRGRWGGVVTGDKVKLHTDMCVCGRRSSSISEVGRYADIAESEEKLTCAGTMEAYARGELGA
jgi:hypothetical protein